MRPNITSHRLDKAHLNVRRLPYGGVDFDLYREQSALMRAQARADLARRALRRAAPLMGALAILIAYALLLPREETGATDASADVPPMTRYASVDRRPLGAAPQATIVLRDGKPTRILSLWAFRLREADLN